MTTAGAVGNRLPVQRRMGAPAGLLRLQGQAGNAAVAQLVARRAPVQREVGGFDGLEPVNGLFGGQTTAGQTDAEAGAGTGGETATTGGATGEATGDLIGLQRQDGLDFGTWDRRPRVKRLQGILNDKVGAGLNVDGMWGQKTSDALAAFQSREGLTVQEVVDQPCAERLTGSGPKPEEDGVVDPDGESAEAMQPENGAEKPRGGGRPAFLDNLINVSRQIESAPALVPEVQVSRDGPTGDPDLKEDLGQRWFSKVRCLQTFLLDMFGRLVTMAKALAGQAISTAASVIHGAIVGVATGIAGPVGFLVGLVGGWFIKEEVAKWVKNKANAAIDKIVAMIMPFIQKINAGIMKLLKPVIRTMAHFLVSWENVVKWVDPWLGNVHDAVKWIRDTLAKFKISSDKLNAVVTTIEDVRSWGKKPLEMGSCNK